MTHRTTPAERQARMCDTLVQQLTALVDQFTTWVQDPAQSHRLADIEQQVLHVGKPLLTSLLSTVLPLLLPTYDPPECPCACGATARYLRDRAAQVRTVVGTITVTRPYYHCATCGHGHAPLDQQLQFCAGSLSGGLEELLALLGAQTDSFEAAVPILERLTLVHVAPNTVRAATERLGRVVDTVEQEALQAALANVPPAPRLGRSAPPPHLPVTYVSMDGTMVHRDGGGRK